MTGDRPFTAEEFQELVAAARCPRDAALIQFERWTGLRISEVLLLRVEDVARSWSAINDVIYAWQPKVGSRRAVKVCKALAQALRRYFAWLAGQSICFARGRPLFFSPRFPRRPLTSRQACRIIQAAAVRAGLSGRIGTHSLRKTGAEAIYLHTGFDIKAVQEWLGHRSVASTGFYVGFQSKRKAWDSNDDLGDVVEDEQPRLWRET